MATSSADIIAQIRAAFPSKRPPGLALIEPKGRRYPGDEYEQTEIAFRDKDDWTAVDRAFLDLGANSAALSFMSGAALRFYIPAYMVADLEAKLCFVEPSFALINGFDPENSGRARERIAPLYAERGMAMPAKFDFAEYARRIWAPLDAAQVRAIIAYLEYIVSRDGRALADGQAEALRTYWHPSANR